MWRTRGADDSSNCRWNTGCAGPSGTRSTLHATASTTNTALAANFRVAAFIGCLRTVSFAAGVRPRYLLNGAQFGAAASLACREIVTHEVTHVRRGVLRS